VEEKVTYVGLDVHPETTFAVWGRPHEPVKRLEFPTTEEGFRILNRRIGRQGLWAAYEASSCGFVPYEILRKMGWAVSIVPPTHLPRSLKRQKNKADPKDAEAMRDVVMAHGELGTEMAEVAIPDPELRDDRELTRQRLQLGEKISAVKAGVLQLLRRHGVDRPKTIKSRWTKAHVAWLRGLDGAHSPIPPGARQVMASQLRMLDFLEKEKEAMDKALDELSRKPRYAGAVGRMRRHKGVGLLTAMVLLLEMGNPGRFRNRRQVGSFFGLVPSRRDSGNQVNHLGHITRLGSSRARKALNQAAWAFLRTHDKWKAWFKRLAGRRGKKRAVVALMRKLAIILWHEAVAA